MHYPREFHKIKPIIQFIFEFRCVLCSHFSLSNHTHHIDKNRNNSDPLNLTCVCSDCHSKLHSVVDVKFPKLSLYQRTQLLKLRRLLSKYNK